jgi:tRNA(fMet)-specific endonuclease VapC
MADRSVAGASPLIDTSVLIDHFRKSNKANSRLVRLAEQYDHFCISTVTEFEILAGATAEQQSGVGQV